MLFNLWFSIEVSLPQYDNAWKFELNCHEEVEERISLESKEIVYRVMIINVFLWKKSYMMLERKFAKKKSISKKLKRELSEGKTLFYFFVLVYVYIVHKY